MLFMDITAVLSMVQMAYNKGTVGVNAITIMVIV